MDRQAPVGESPAAPQTKQTTIAEAKQVLVHFIVGNRREITLFRTDTPQDQLKDLFRSAAEAGARDILKLYNSSGLLMNINSSLSPNTPQNPYTLKVVAADPGGMLLEEVGLDVRALEQRVAELEKQLRAGHEQLPPAVHELKTQVDHFRNKLETTETLSWLGFYKQLPEPLSTEECQRLKYRRKSDSIRKKVKENFYKICESSVTDPVSEWLRLPTFDSRQWEDEELLLLLQYMFQDLNFLAKFAIDLTTLRNFLFEVYKNYNDVPFHNFRHCFCVSQMMYAIACYVDLPSKIGDLETLILLVSSICHDLDHPGYNNIYQINAKTELALRYNDISPLENHHCSVAFRILEMQDCNIFKSFTKEQFRQVREGMIRCILATDMARHNEILAQFKDITPTFDYSNKAHTNLLCMVLIKVADISNEARPMDVAEPWLDRLLQEFFKQSDAEKLEGLPVTPFMDRDKITKPSSQCSFIGFVLLPLFEALGELFTELQELIVQPVRDALEYYRRLNEQNKEERHHRKSVVADLIDHPIPTGHQHHHHHRSHSPGFTSHGEKEILQQEKVTSNGLPKSGSNHSVRSRKAAFQVRSRSRSTEEEPEVIEMNTSDDDDHNSLPDVAEDTESGDSETATEVEVSEKTLKFKISTEGSVSSGRKSYPGSRKGSRERGQYLNCYEVARAVQGEKDRRKIIHGGLSFDQNALRGKKLSFDTTELLDEQARRYFRQYKKVSIDSTSPDDVEKRDSFCASPKFEERRSSNLSDCSNQEERRPSILSPKNEERKSIQFYSSPSLDERRSSAISSKNEENKTHLEERRSTICTSPNSEKKKLQFCCPDDDKKLERSSRPSECTTSTSPRVEKKSPKSYRDFCQSCLEATKSESSVKDNKRLSLEKKETQVCSISKTENNSEVYSSPKFKTPTGNTFSSILQNQSISTNETRNLENREPLNDLSSQNMEVEEAEKFDGSSELNERNGFGKSDVNKVSKFLKSDNSRPCETFINKQNNISAIMTDVCENSSIIENDNGNEGKQEEETKTEECNKIDLSTKKKEKIIEVETVSNSCKLDKISVDKSNKLVQGDTADATKTEEKPSPNGNRSLLARLKHFTDRLGFSIDKESNSKFMKHMKIHSLSFKNNNGRMTLPLRYRKKTDETCCKAEPVLDEQKRASTLPKLSKFTFGGKKNWKQRLLGKDRTSNSLDNIPPSSPLSLKASTSYSANNSRTTSPRKESFLDKENKINPICLSKTDLSAALEPDPKVLTTSIELM